MTSPGLLSPPRFPFSYINSPLHIMFYSDSMPETISNMFSPTSSPAPLNITSLPAANPIYPLKPECASSSNKLLLHPTSCSPRASSAPSFSPSASRHEIVEDIVDILQKIFQSPRRQSAPESSVVETDGMDVSCSIPRLLTPADEQRILDDKKEVRKRNKVFNERLKLKQASRERVSKMARATVTSTQPSLSVYFSKPVTFMRKTNRLRRASDEIQSLQRLWPRHLWRLQPRVYLLCVR